MTKDEASRNFIWRVAGLILRALAWRNKSIVQIEADLGWKEGTLEKFLVNAVADGFTDEFRLRDLAALMHVLDFHMEFSIIPAPEKPTQGGEDAA